MNFVHILGVKEFSTVKTIQAVLSYLTLCSFLCSFESLGMGQTSQLVCSEFSQFFWTLHTSFDIVTHRWDKSPNSKTAYLHHLAKLRASQADL